METPRIESRAGAAVLVAACLSAACATGPAGPGGAGGASKPEQDTAGRGGLPTVEERTSGLHREEGAAAWWWDPGAGELLLEVPAEGRPFLYTVSLPHGLGSNDVGLDRAQLGDSRLVEFRHAGDRVLLVAPNLAWRSGSDDPAVRAGVTTSFAESVLWGFEPVARSGERFVVDATDFLLRDAHHVQRKLQDAGQGSFSLARSRSAVLPDASRAFPENTELEVLQTFTSDRGGREVRATAADPSAVTLRVRHSLVALPDLADHDYAPRAFDPRCGFFPQTWRDPTGPIDAPLERRVVRRHHLTADDPIVYYVDRAAPEPVRTALLEGARYWEPVFAAAGFPGGFRAELLPEGADPQDVRLNVVTWVNRSTRGWSYGNSLVDPRTGEILKGHVTLGALRVRQDVLLFEGLLSPYAAAGAPAEEVHAAALARIRQLSAHEIGHTLGLAHNFAASVNDRASVMDYPAPLVRVTADGGLDLSDAYAPGCGAWDEVAVRYGYGVDPDPSAGLDAAFAAGLLYLSDADARGADRAHPAANLWDNGDDAVAQLLLDYEVRRVALARFGEGAVQAGRPLASLEHVLVPLWLRHRYQLEAAVRQVGGVDYAYDVRGHGAPTPVRSVGAATQRRALDAVLVSLSPGFLRFPDGLVELVPPFPPGSTRGREGLPGLGPLLDPLGAAAASAELTLSLLLDPARLARARDQGPEGGAPVLRALVEATFPDEVDAAERDVVDVVRALVVDHLIDLSADGSAATRVRADADAALALARARLDDGDALERLLAARVDRWLDERERDPDRSPRPRVPPGSPIGCDHAP